MDLKFEPECSSLFIKTQSPPALEEKPLLEMEIKELIINGGFHSAVRNKGIMFFMFFTFTLKKVTDWPPCWLSEYTPAGLKCSGSYNHHKENV